MGQYEDTVHRHYDERISTLGNIKTRSIGADVLTLTAMRVLVYAQLEGGIKELVALVLKNLNARHLQLGEIAPNLLSWRNADDLSKFKAAVNFSNVGLSFPFGNLPAKTVKVKPLNRRREFNQMGWEGLSQVYRGLNLDTSRIRNSSTAVQSLVGARNDAAHHGILPTLARMLLEGQVRSEVPTVELILTDFALQLLPFFVNSLHRR